MKKLAADTTSLQRRDFMLTLGLGTMAGAAAMLSGKPADVAAAVAEIETKPAKKGYQASEHVKTYYRTTRI